MEGPVGWSEVIGVWLDVESGRPVEHIIMLPGAKTKIATQITLTNNMFYFIVTDGDIPIDEKEILTMLSKRNVSVGLHVCQLTKGNIRLLYNWFTKVVKNDGFLERFEFVDITGDPEKSEVIEVYHIPDEEELAFYRHLIKVLETAYEGVLKGFKEMDDSSLELEILGPSYLLPK